jgi:2-keto-4-pentenoate hydratase/2-oxohepta-3-ene-1,7-dioic acid hydratase in catechol pathway
MRLHPTKIILVGLNYRAHARELGMNVPKEPVIFLKPPSALIGDGDAIVYPAGAGRIDYEAELALVIRKQGRNIPERKVHDYIAGYTCLNDVTARTLQKKDGQWTRSKSFDTFCPVGPRLVEKFDPACVRIRSYLNGVKKQDASTVDFIFPVPALVSFISRVMTLAPGDIISTGTPPGVGPMRVGDTIEIEIEGIGSLTNRIVKEKGHV